MTSAPLGISLLAAVLLLGGCVGAWGDGLAYGPTGTDAPSEDPDDPDDSDDDDPADDSDDDDDADEPTGPDADGDGHHWPDDCWDGDASVFPGAPELCDGIDNDCSGEIDDVDDADGDGFDGCLDCDDSDPSVSPVAFESCDDGVDDDCDGSVDEGAEVDNDGDGLAACAGDCDDDDASTYPGAPGDDDPEGLANGRDDDCDGLTDEAFAAPGMDGFSWIVSDLEVLVLTGSDMADQTIGDALAAFTPPVSELVALVLDPTTDVGGEGFSALAGLGATSESGTFGWSEAGSPGDVWCSRVADSFACDAVGSVSIDLPLSDPLVLLDLAFEGDFVSGTDLLAAGFMAAAITPETIPDLVTPAGSLSTFLAERPLDLDRDEDGVLDAWSVLFSFTPLDQVQP